jgi:transposase
MASANAFKKRIRFVELINESIVWDQKQWQVSPGDLLKALVLNTFIDKRAPLYKLSEAYQGIDTEVLFGDGITHEQIADSAVGEALERLHAANAGKLFQTLCLSVYEHFGIPMKRMHSDTTSVSFYGSYEEED